MLSWLLLALWVPSARQACVTLQQDVKWLSSVASEAGATSFAQLGWNFSTNATSKLFVNRLPINKTRRRKKSRPPTTTSVIVSSVLKPTRGASLATKSFYATLTFCTAWPRLSSCRCHSLSRRCCQN